MFGCFASRDDACVGEPATGSCAPPEPGSREEPSAPAVSTEQIDKGSKSSLTGVRSLAEEQELEGKAHLIMMVSGLGGCYKDWDGLCQVMAQSDGLEQMALVPSMANSRKQSVDGIHVCGDRLIEEVRRLVSIGKDLRCISFICHSLGGLIGRYAIGVLFDADSGLVAGLEPRHFMTVATPHLGCDSDGAAQVPLVTWVGAVPLIGRAADKAAKAAAASVAKSLAGASGTQLFRQDGDPEAGEEPIVSTLTKGVYYDALAAFASRTAYANSWGDTLVGWANSSLRHLHELPRVPVLGTSKSVHLHSFWASDPQHLLLDGSLPGQRRLAGPRSDLRAASSCNSSPGRTRMVRDGKAESDLRGADGAEQSTFRGGHPQPEESQLRQDPPRGYVPSAPVAAAALADADGGSKVEGAPGGGAAEGGGIGGQGDQEPREASESVSGASSASPSKPLAPRSEALLLEQQQQEQQQQHSGARLQPQVDKLRGSSRPGSKNKGKIRFNTYTDELTHEMLSRLQTLTWNRVDLTFKNAFHALDSHNHIKASKNKGVARHIIQLLKDMEAAGSQTDDQGGNQLMESRSMACELVEEDNDEDEQEDGQEKEEAKEEEAADDETGASSAAALQKDPVGTVVSDISNLWGLMSSAKDDASKLN